MDILSQNNFYKKNLLFRKPEDGSIEDILKYADTEEDEGGDEKKGRALRCGHCGHKITYESFHTQKNGHHKHVFNNPAGFVFEIGCFSAAEGCAVQGQPTLEFTWFSGFAWRFAVCAKCLYHLGWRYDSSSGEGFFGLILANLKEDEE